MEFFNRIHSKYTGIKGFITVYNDAIRVYDYPKSAGEGARPGLLGKARLRSDPRCFSREKVDSLRLEETLVRRRQENRSTDYCRPKHRRSCQKSNAVPGDHLNRKLQRKKHRPAGIQAIQTKPALPVSQV